MSPQDGFIPAHGGYRKLRSYQKAQIVFDATVFFCRRSSTSATGPSTKWSRQRGLESKTSWKPARLPALPKKWRLS
jgi:hypothetical protein